MMTNQDLLKIVKEITVAKLSNTSLPVSKTSGEDVGEFMESIYNKLVELNKNEDSNGFPKA